MTPSCRTTCWSAAALAGAAVAVVLVIAAGMALGPTLLLGMLVFVLGGALASGMLCTERRIEAEARAGEPHGVPSSVTWKRPPEAASAPAAARGQDLAGAAEQPVTGLDAALARARSPAIDASPELLAEPRGGKADDLKAIRGIGPALERMLNEAGVWHYDQIASWRARDIAFIDGQMAGFHGRITRDGWIKQAREIVRSAQGKG